MNFQFKNLSKLIFPAIFVCAFFVLAGHAQAATYYVDATAGNDSWTGTAGIYQSGSTGPWRTIAKVNSFSFQPGDDVYFKCGGVWSGTQLSIDWSGLSSTNLSVVGAYYMNGSAQVIGVSGAKPKINGVYSDDAALRVPSARSASLIKVADSRAHVRVENIRVENSAGMAFDAAGCDDVHFLNTEAYYTYNGGMRLSNTTNCSVIGCLIDDTGRWTVDPFPDDVITGRPPVLGLQNINTYVTVKGNTLRNNKGEGIGIYHGSHDFVIEENLVYNQMWISIYAERCYDGVIRNNLIYGTGTNLPPTIQRAGGISVNIENTSGYNNVLPVGPGGQQVMSNVNVYGNLVARAGRGIGVTGGSNYASYIMEDVKIFNNTVIDSVPGEGVTWANNYTSGLYGAGVTPATFSRVEFRNNISVCLSSGCRQSDLTYRPGITWDYNFWGTTGVVEPGTVGPHDPTRVNLTFAKTFGWTNLTAGSLSPNDFKLLANSPAIDKGVALSTVYNRDYFGTLRPQGAGWDIGAHEYPVGDTQAPGAPSGLNVR